MSDRPLLKSRFVCPSVPPHIGSHFLGVIGIALRYGLEILLWQLSRDIASYRYRFAIPSPERRKERGLVNNVPGEEGENTSHNTAVALIVFSLCCHCLRLPLRLSLSLTHTHTVSSHLIPLANQSVRSESSLVESQ